MAEVAKAISVNPAKVVGTSRAAHGAFTDMPSATDPTALHDWVKANYLLYGSWIISAGAQTAPVPSDMPDRQPESNEGTRERDYAPIKETGYVIFASFQDPDCKDYFGFMSVQLDKCVASWLGSDAITGPQTYYTVRASVSESMITVTTHMYSDAQCLSPAAPSVNMSTNMACNAWGAHDQVFSKFSFAKTVPQIGAGAMFTGYGDAACETSVQEALYVDQTDADFCSGSLKAICDDAGTKATLVHYIDVDYECNNHAVAEGYPMTMTPSCAWDNSFGLSAYGKTVCGSASEGYMAIPGVAPQLGGAYTVPGLEVWKPEEAAAGVVDAAADPEVSPDAAAPPADVPAPAAGKAAPADAKETSTKEAPAAGTIGGPAAQKNGPPPGSTAASKRKHA